MATVESQHEVLLRRAIHDAAEGGLFADVQLDPKQQAAIKSRIRDLTRRRQRQIRTGLATGSLAAVAMLALVFGAGPLGRRLPAPPPAAVSQGPAPLGPASDPPAVPAPPPTGSSIRQPANGPDVAVQAPVPAPATGGPIPSNGPAPIPFAVEVRPLGGDPPPAGALPEFAVVEPVVVVRPGTDLPLRLTWRANGGEEYRADLAQSAWELVTLDGERQHLPLQPTAVQSAAFSRTTPLSLDVAVPVPAEPGWYNLYLTAHAASAEKAGARGAGTAIRLVVAYPADRIRTGDFVPAGVAATFTRDGVTLQVQRVRMNELATEVDYELTLPAGMHAPAGHNTFLAWDGGGWADPITVGEREGAPDADGRVRTITGQALFPPTPRSAASLQLRIPSLDAVVPAGGPYGSVQTFAGPWVARVDLP